MIAFACSSRWIRPCFSRDADQSWRIDLVPACPSSPPQEPSFRIAPLGFKDHALNAPTLHSGPLPAPYFRTRFRARFASQNPPKTGQTSPCPAARPAGGVVGSGALVGATGGTQTHSRRTGWKLGRLRYARQGLVRVPESNTKYGGWGGITGASAAPVMGPSIGESSGNPKRKNVPEGVDFTFAPLFTGAVFFQARGLRSQD
jgi:hypothetical protein